MTTATIKESHTRSIAEAIDRALADLPNVLLPGEVAELFGVDSRTLGRWEIPNTFRTLGGHKRYHKVDIRELLIARKTAEAVAAGRRAAK